LKENIFDDDEELDVKRSHQIKKTKNEKATNKQTHATEQNRNLYEHIQKREDTTQRGNVVINNNNNIESIIIVLGSKWIRDKHSSVIFVPSMPPRFSKENDYY
jgi:hypothetical protein